MSYRIWFDSGEVKLNVFGNTEERAQQALEAYLGRTPRRDRYEIEDLYTSRHPERIELVQGKGNEACIYDSFDPVERGYLPPWEPEPEGVIEVDGVM